MFHPCFIRGSSLFRLRWILVLSSAAVAGCARLGPSEVMPSTLVAGKLHVGSFPVSGGWVEFYPVDGTRGHLRSAPVNGDGSFEATRVAVGRNLVRVVQPRCAHRVNPQFQQFTSPIRREIPPGNKAYVDIDLARERPRSD